MIIIIGGIPCSGKSCLARIILSNMGLYVEYEPMKLFACQKYDDVLVVGRYDDNTFGGTDRLSYGTINKFRDFINQEVPKYKQLVVEGDRIFRSVDIEWVLDNHEAICYILTVSAEEEKRRHLERQDTQTEKWLQGRRSQISNIQTNFALMGRIEIRQNETMEDSENLKSEILKWLKT